MPGRHLWILEEEYFTLENTAPNHLQVTWKAANYESRFWILEAYLFSSWTSRCGKYGRRHVYAPVEPPKSEYLVLKIWVSDNNDNNNNGDDDNFLYYQQ